MHLPLLRGPYFGPRSGRWTLILAWTMDVLTDVGLRALLKQPHTQQVEVPDGTVPGLRIRIGSRGRGTWTLRLAVSGEGGVTERGYQRVGRKHRLTLGEYPVLSLQGARARAYDLIDQARRGLNPVAAIERRATANGLTVRALWGRFLADYIDSRELRARQKYVLAFTTHIDPVIGSHSAELLTREDARLVMNKARERRNRPNGVRGGRLGGVEAARTAVGVLRQMISWGIEESILRRRDNPVSKLQKNLPRKRTGERVLSLGEARIVFRAAGQIGYPMGTLVQLMLLTACRSAEWSRARRGWIDYQEALSVVPAQGYKSNHVHVVPLVPGAIGLLATIPPARTGDFLLSSTGGSRPLQGIAKFFRTRLQDEILALSGEKLPHFTSHALRRTVATRLAESLGDPGDKLIKRVLGHADGSVTAIYNRYGYVKEMRAALERWSQELTQG